MIEADRQVQLEACIPDIWNHDSYLYVGANEKRFHFKEKLRQLALCGDLMVDVVEANPDNISFLNKQTWIREVCNDDIRSFAFNGGYPWMDGYDVIIWSHGPTCLDTKDLAEQTIQFLKKVSKLIVIMCPWGLYPESQDKKSYYDINKFALYPYFFEQLGFETNTLGSPDVAGSNLLAWYRK